MAKNDKKNTDIIDAQAGEALDTVQSETAEALDTEGLVKMQKDGTHLHVHPTTVKAHEDAGWKAA